MEEKKEVTTHTSDPAKHPKGQSDPNGTETQQDNRDDLEKNLHKASKDDKGPGDNK